MRGDAMKSKQNVQNITLSAMCFALGMVLPLATMQLKALGQALSPMHLPVLLCGLIAGPYYGLCVGLLLPVTRSFVFDMPKIFPTAIAMSFELAAYGSIAGYLYRRSKWKCILAVYKALIPAMILGRILGGFVQYLLLGGNYGFTAWVAGYVTGTMPGLVLQLILIPVIMLALGRAGLIHFSKEKRAENIA